MYQIHKGQLVLCAEKNQAAESCAVGAFDPTIGLCTHQSIHPTICSSIHPTGHSSTHTSLINTFIQPFTQPVIHPFLKCNLSFFIALTFSLRVTKLRSYGLDCSAPHAHCKGGLGVKPARWTLYVNAVCVTSLLG